MPVHSREKDAAEQKRSGSSSPAPGDQGFAMVVSVERMDDRLEQPSGEVSKDIEPSVEHGDKYLKILKEEIRRFKSE